MKKLKIFVLLLMTSSICSAQLIATNYITSPYIKASNLMTDTTLIVQKYRTIQLQNGRSDFNFDGTYETNDSYYSLSSPNGLLHVSYASSRPIDNFQEYIDGWAETFYWADTYEIHKEVIESPTKYAGFFFVKSSYGRNSNITIFISNKADNKLLISFVSTNLSTTEKVNWARDYIANTNFK